MDLAKLQQLFQQALITQQASVALQEIIVSGALSPKERLNIYRNSQQAILITALKQTYSVCLALVGEDCFHGLATRFIAQETQNPNNLQSYGARFAEFIETFSTTSKVPYLADVARLEWAILQASIGEDVSSMDFSRLAQISESQQKDLCFYLPKHATLLTSDYPIDVIWQAHQSDHLDEIPVDLQRNQVRLIIWRRQLEILCERLTQEQWFVLRHIQAGDNLDKICQQLMLQPELPSIEAVLPTIMVRGWVAQFTIKIRRN